MKPIIMKPILIAAGLSLALAPPVLAQEMEDFTARLNRAPGQAAPAATAQPQTADTPPAASPDQPPLLEDLTARLNQIRANRTGEETPPEPQGTPEPAAPPAAQETSPDDGAPDDPPAPDEAPETPADEPATSEPEPLTSQAGLAFRVSIPEDFDLIERPSGPGFDVYQVSRDGVPFVGIYVGCCSPFPIYDGRQTTAGARTSVIVNEDSDNRAVEHLFVRDSDGRQIHVWLHSVSGADRAVAERIAQTVDPR